MRCAPVGGFRPGRGAPAEPGEGVGRADRAPRSPPDTEQAAGPGEAPARWACGEEKKEGKERRGEARTWGQRRLPELVTVKSREIRKRKNTALSAPPAGVSLEARRLRAQHWLLCAAPPDVGERGREGGGRGRWPQARPGSAPREKTTQAGATAAWRPGQHTAALASCAAPTPGLRPPGCWGAQVATPARLQRFQEPPPSSPRNPKVQPKGAADFVPGEKATSQRHLQEGRRVPFPQNAGGAL